MNSTEDTIQKMQDFSVVFVKRNGGLVIYFWPTIWSNMGQSEPEWTPTMVWIEWNVFICFIHRSIRIESNHLRIIRTVTLMNTRIYAIYARRLNGNVLNVRLWCFFALYLFHSFTFALCICRSPISIIMLKPDMKNDLKTVFNTCHASIINDRTTNAKNKRETISYWHRWVFRLQNALPTAATMVKISEFLDFWHHFSLCASLSVCLHCAFYFE